MKVNSQRDIQLWTTSIIAIVAFGCGLTAMVAPSIVWSTVTVHFNRNYLPQLFWGMVSLSSLLVGYLILQKRRVSASSRALLEELIVSEQLGVFSLLDPVTQLLNSCAIEPIASKEMARSNRLGSPLSFATVGLDNAAAITKHLGVAEGERALYEAGRLLKSTFRGSDVLIRSSANEFVVIMPDTTEQQAEGAFVRLRSKTESWNAEVQPGRELDLSWGVAGCLPGASTTDLLEKARRCMFLSSQKIFFAH